jgi:hypothetical protein
MTESPIGVDFESDYEGYLRGCMRLDWQPLSSEVFSERYGQYTEESAA